MKKFKKILVFALVGLMVILNGLAGVPTKAHAEEETPRAHFKKSYQFIDNEKGVEVNLDYEAAADLAGEVDVQISLETNQENIDRYEKYARKKIDSADIGEIILVSMTPTNQEDAQRLNGLLKFKAKLPKFYKNKELAVIPFSDERTAQAPKQVTVHDDGTITFSGNITATAYVIVYNGAYKDVIAIVILLLLVLIICVTVKILCLRKDNPAYLEKKKNKAIKKKKQQHKQNKKLAQELKRERERMKQKQNK